MRPTATVFSAALLVAGLAACQASPKSAAGFRLPNGDPARGEKAFVDLRCNACHRVAGAELPPPVASPPVPVVLGGEVPHVRTDGDLVTAIIHPSQKIVPGFRPEDVQRGDLSRMPDYGEIMTVRQMIDLVAFLQSRYQVVRPGAMP